MSIVDVMRCVSEMIHRNSTDILRSYHKQIGEHHARITMQIKVIYKIVEAITCS